MAKSSEEPDHRERPWDVAKYWLTVAAVIAMLLLQVFLLFDGAVRNGQCMFTQFITLECNRWDAAFKPWD